MHGKRDYKELTAKVSKIDKSAAKYMREQAPKELRDFVYCGELNSSFIWGDTPQGHDFWENIYDKLNEGM